MCDGRGRSSWLFSIIQSWSKSQILWLPPGSPCAQPAPRSYAHALGHPRSDVEAAARRISAAASSLHVPWAWGWCLREICGHLHTCEHPKIDGLWWKASLKRMIGGTPILGNLHIEYRDTSGDWGRAGLIIHGDFAMPSLGSSNRAASQADPLRGTEPTRGSCMKLSTQPSRNSRRNPHQNPCKNPHQKPHWSLGGTASELLEQHSNLHQHPEPTPESTLELPELGCHCPRKTREIHAKICTMHPMPHQSDRSFTKLASLPLECSTKMFPPQPSTEILGRNPQPQPFTRTFLPQNFPPTTCHRNHPPEPSIELSTEPEPARNPGIHDGSTGTSDELSTGTFPHRKLHRTSGLRPWADAVGEFTKRAISNHHFNHVLTTH